MEQAASITTSNLLGIGWLSEINLTGNFDADWRRKVACACATRMENARWPPHNAPRRIRLAHFSRGAKVGAWAPHPFGFWLINGGLLWLTKNRSTATSGLKEKWDRHSCLSRIYR